MIVASGFMSEVYIIIVDFGNNIILKNFEVPFYGQPVSCVIYHILPL